MYGTIARMRTKPGTEQQFDALMKEYESIEIPGFVATHVYCMDSDPNEVWLAVVFENRDSYFANAESPEQDARYRKMLDLLVSEPEWHDGEIVYSHIFAGAPAS